MSAANMETERERFNRIRSEARQNFEREKEERRLLAEEEAAEAKKNRVKNAFKQVGAGMAEGGQSFVKGGADLMSDLAVRGKGLHKSVHGEASGKLVALFWIAIGVQIIDAFLLGFNRQVTLYTAIALYIALVFLAALFFHESRHFLDVRQIFIFVLISAFYIVVPLFMYLVPKISVVGPLTLSDWASFFLAFFPLWPIYIGVKARIPFVHTYVNIWLVVILIVFLLAIGFQINASTLSKIGGRPEVLQLGTVFNYLVEKGAEGISNFWKSIRLIPITQQILNASGLGYYTGMIDNNEKEPVGLYLSNVRTADPYFFTDSPVTIWADIRGKSFVEEIRVEPHCFIEDKYSGTAEPSLFRIFGEEHDTLSCTFDSLPKGSYLAKVTATFNFETWAYVTYTFVDQEVKRAIEIAGKNVNSELDVDSLPRAVYSNGPVMLGMASMVDQPIGIDTKYNTREPVLGVTLDNAWTDGRIERNYGFVIQVPNDFELIKCDRGTPTVETDKEPGYDFYTFTREQLNDSRINFQSVTCRLHIKEPLKLLSGAQKVERTFVTKAKYDYTLEKSVRIYVRE